MSLPGTTCYLEDSQINVLSPSRMANAAKEMDCKTLIVKGKFEHVSFISDEEAVPLVVFEVVPPNPPKLVELVKSSINSGNVNHAVSVVPEIMDITKIVKGSKNPIIIFPCQASGLEGPKNTYFLDQYPDISEEELKNVTLIGCDLSLRIFKSLYETEPEFYNFCPKKNAQDEKPKYYAIMKCCQIKEGYERIGNTVVVPWGATQREVEDALNELLTQF
jgi:hypothetical protein